MERLVTEGAPSSAASAELSARDRVRERRKARKRHKTMRTAAIALALCGTVIGGYSLGFSYFSSHYFPGTTVAGIDASGMTEADLAQAVQDKVKSFAAEAGNGSFKLAFSGADVDLSCDAQKIANTLMVCQDASAWPAGVAGAIVREESPTLSFNKEKLTALVNKAVESYNKSARQPVAATLVLNKAHDEFSVQEEEDGTALDAATVFATVSAQLSQGATNIELSKADLVQPAFREDDEATRAALERANKVFDLQIPLVHDKDVLSNLTSSVFAPWLVVNDDLSLGVDQEAAAKWAGEYLWQSADYADDANAYVIDAPAFATALSGAIGSGSAEALQIPYTTVARYLPGGGTLNSAAWNPDLGRYIDVNKKDQVACLYDTTGRVLWETVVTTGDEASGHGTPTGEYSIYDKQTDFTLIGFDEDGDGQPDYEHHVDFWMPFNQGIGLHDASWRSVYGGTEYLTGGSGGCVNVPRDAVEVLYSLTHENEVVIVHE